ncbi:unnamed protein product [Gongylonema pulchrum]|uniref:Peptidase_S8 domain-containing protein n=1 Tax=Gongylonema pulchrum TaxID=637853 RepID=A0A183DP00_9BILA|nr:unnamed protein product [Gongylonema pulchrum]
MITAASVMRRQPALKLLNLFCSRMILRNTLLIRILIAAVEVHCLDAQDDRGFGENNPDKTLSTVTSSPVPLQRSPVPPRRPVLSAPMQKDAIANAKHTLQTYSIARSPLILAKSLESDAANSAAMSKVDTETEAFSSHNFNPTTPQTQETHLAFSHQPGIATNSTVRAVSGFAQLPLQTTEIPQKISTDAKNLDFQPTSATILKLLPDSPSSDGISHVAQQSNGFEDDAEQLSEEDYGSNSESVKPDAVDNEAIEELVNRFLNSDTMEGGVEQKLNKEVQKLINSSSYWNTNNLQPDGSIKEETKAQEWMDGYAVEAQKVLHEVADAGWNYVTSVSHLTKQLLDEAEETLTKFVKASSRQAKQFDIRSIGNPSLKRQFELLLVEGVGALDEGDFDEYNDAQKLIAKSYAETSVCEMGSTTICPYRVSDIVSIVAHENNTAKALHFWTAWRDALGPKLAATYNRLIQLINKGTVLLIILGAELNGFGDAGAMWRSPYDLAMPGSEVRGHGDIVAVLQQLYQKISPFYKQLHAYLRRRIAALYGLRNVQGLTQDGPIPAHLLSMLLLCFCNSSMS